GVAAEGGRAVVAVDAQLVVVVPDVEARIVVRLERHRAAPGQPGPPAEGGVAAETGAAVVGGQAQAVVVVPQVPAPHGDRAVGAVGGGAGRLDIAEAVAVPDVPVGEVLRAQRTVPGRYGDAV